VELGQPGQISSAAPSPQLNISEVPFVSTLQRLKPLNEVFAHPPSRRSGGLGDNGTSGGQRCTLGLQIHCQVFVSGVDARVMCGFSSAKFQDVRGVSPKL
jgi:hypothetical protein